MSKIGKCSICGETRRIEKHRNRCHPCAYQARKNRLQNRCTDCNKLLSLNSTQLLCKSCGRKGARMTVGLASVTVLYPVDCPATTRVQILADALAA